MSAKPDQPVAAEKRPSSGRPRRPQRRVRWRVLLFLLLTAAAGLLWFAPEIIARTPLRQQIVPALVPGYPAAITTGSASLGWFAPVVLRDVVFDDLSGETLLRVPVIRSERSLADIVLDSRNAGTIHLESPEARVAVRAGGSSVEDVIGPVLAARGGNSSRGFALESSGGKIEIIDTSEHRRTRIDSLAFSLQKPSELAGAWQLSCAGSVDRPGIPGTFRVEGTLGPPPGDHPAAAASLHAKLRTDSLVLDEFQSVVARVQPSTVCAGMLDTDVDVLALLDDGGHLLTFSAGGRVASQEFELATTGTGGAQRWKLRDLAAGGRVDYSGGKLALDDVRIKSDLARLNASGMLHLARSLGDTMARPSAAEGALSVLASGDCRIQGEMDLTKFARVFPDLIRVREGTELTSGTLRLDLAGRSDAGRHRWDGSVEAKSIAAVTGGRSITWDQPVRVTFQAHDSADGPVLDALDCKSEFLRASGRGSLADATVSVGCDLDRLSAELGRFLDLEQWRMAGKMSLELSCRRPASETFDVNGRATIENFAFVLPGSRPWNEQRLEARFSVLAAAHEHQLSRIEKGSLVLTSGADRLDVNLLQPMPWGAEQKAAESPITIELAGDLATWRARTHPLLPLADWDIGGTVQLKTRVVVSPESLRWEEGSATITGLRAWGHGLFLSDSNVKLQTSGRWDRLAGRWTLPRTTWASNSLSLRADEVVLEKGHNRPVTLAGNIVFRGGVEELSRWLRDPNVSPASRTQGSVTGRLKMSQADGLTDADMVLQFDNLIASMPAAKQSTVGWRETWRENQVVVKGRGRYDHQLDTLEIAGLNLLSEGLKFDVRGAVGELTSRPSFDVAGNIEYDWQNVIPRLRPWLGDEIQLTGQEKRTFALRGPRAVASARSSSADARAALVIAGTSEDPSGLSGEAALGWKTAKIYGLDIGPTELQVQLAGTGLKFSPLDIAVGDGRLTLAPEIELLRDPPMLVLPPGRVAEKVQLSPEICRTWLKYVAPLLADATRAEGRFSLDLEGANVPLSAPKTGEIVGTLAIHQGNVSPGPMARQVVQIAEQVQQILKRRLPSSSAKQANPWVKVPEQNVAFRMAEGRVQHQSMEFLVGDVSIRTEGSVGFDESLALVASVPVRDEWVQGDKLLAGLKGQTLRIPITGTLNRPHVDSQVLSTLARQMGGSAAGQLIREGLGNQLDRILGPKK